MTLRMSDQARQWLQQKMSLGFMKEKTIIETTDPLGSPKPLKPRFVHKNVLDKSLSHLSLHTI